MKNARAEYDALVYEKQFFFSGREKDISLIYGVNQVIMTTVKNNSFFLDEKKDISLIYGVNQAIMTTVNFFPVNPRYR